MLDGGYKFECKETIKKRWPLVLVGSLFFLAGLITVFSLVNVHVFHKLPEFWFCLVIIGSSLTGVLIVGLFMSRLYYEVSSNEVVKKLGKRVLSRIDVSDIEGFVAKCPIRLKIAGKRNFIFEGIVLKPSRERLLSVLRELGINEIKVERKKLSLTQMAILAGAILCITHFLCSVIWWIVGTILFFRYEEVGIDWPMFVHAIPAVVFLCSSVLAVVFVFKHRRRAGVILAGTILLTTACCIFEISNNFYQGGGSEYYFTWWWYEPLKTREKSVDISSFPFTNEPTYRCGYIDKAGQWVIEPAFDSCGRFSEGLAVIGIGTEVSANEALPCWFLKLWPPETPIRWWNYEYGYIDTTGKVIVEPQYGSAKEFSDGMARVSLDGKYGYINSKGEVVIDFKYDSKTGDFSEGFAVVVINDEHFFIDKGGDIAFGRGFTDALRFSEGLAAVEVDGKYGYIDRTGDIIIEPQFDYARYFSEGLAAVSIGDKWGYVDKTGRIVIEPNFDVTWGFSEGLATVWIYEMWGSAKKVGYIDKSGRFVIEPRYYWARRFYEGIAQVGSCHGWGYRRKSKSERIDKTGAAVNRPYFDRIWRFSEGLAAVEIDEKYGYVDKTGTIVIEPCFDTAGSFSEGLAEVGIKVSEEAGVLEE